MSALERHHAARRRAPGGGLRLDLTSMIDVTFLLLVYFMAATSFRTGEEVYRMDIPDRADAGAAADPFAMDDEPLRIAVFSLAGLDERSGYRLRLEGPWPQPASFAELATFLRGQLVSPSHPRGLFEADHPVIIEPSAGTHWQHAMQAFNAAAANGYRNVIFAEPSS